MIRNGRRPAITTALIATALLWCLAGCAQRQSLNWAQIAPTVKPVTVDGSGAVGVASSRTP